MINMIEKERLICGSIVRKKLVDKSVFKREVNKLLNDYRKNKRVK